MGMSIDNAIGLLERGSQYNYYDSAEDFCKAYDMAIETMRKYQHIQEIINNAKDSDGAVKYNWLYEQIGEVLIDGNDD